MPHTPPLAYQPKGLNYIHEKLGKTGETRSLPNGDHPSIYEETEKKQIKCSALIRGQDKG